MPLVKCPDCEKMVSDRVSNCPFCGCPSEYFISDVNNEEKEDINTNIANEENTNQDSEKANSSEEESLESIKFNLGEFIIEYPSGCEAFAAFFGNYVHLGDNAYEEMCKIYKDAQTIGKALEILPDKANELIYNAIEYGTKLLYKQNVSMTPEQFIEKYSFKYTIEYYKYYDVTLDKYSEILDMKSEMESYRNAVKASRGRWQGGGFGVSGAIKGAMKASALNMGSDFIHSFGDAAKRNADNEVIRNKLDALYRNSKYQLCHSVKTCIMNVFKAMRVELREINFFKTQLQIDEDKAKAIYENANKYETEDSGLKEKMMNCILYYPADKRYYEIFKDSLLKNENSQFKEFLDFWQLEYLFDDWLNEKAADDKFTQYAIEHGIENFNFEDQTAENVTVLFDILKEWKESLPVATGLGKDIDAYMRSFRKNSEESIRDILVNYLPINIKRKEFIHKCIWNQKYLHINALGSLDSYPSEKIRNMLEEDNDTLDLIFDTSLSNNGKKGIAITRKYVIDLKTKMKLPIEEISEISVGTSNLGKPVLKITDGTLSIHYKQFEFELEEDQCAIYYLKNVLKAYLVRYGNNTHLGSINKEDISEDAIEVDKEEMDKYILLVSQDIDEDKLEEELWWRNQFRRRFKCIRNTYRGIARYDEKNLDIYDFENQNEELQQILGNVSGQYILYAGKCVKITDRYLYIHKNPPFELNKITDMVLFTDLDHRDCVLFVALGNEGYTLSFSVDSSSKIEDMGRILYNIMIALEPMNSPSEPHMYERKHMLYCKECGSMNIKTKLLWQQCMNCNNHKNFLYAQNSDKEILSFWRKAAIGEYMSTEEEKELLRDEEVHAAWINAKYCENKDKKSVDN